MTRILMTAAVLGLAYGGLWLMLARGVGGL